MATTTAATTAMATPAVVTTPVGAKRVVELVLDGPWTVSTATAEQYPSFELQPQLTSLGNLAVPGLLPAFSGTMRYETTVELPYSPERQAIRRVTLRLGEAYETAEVWVNGLLAGVCICPPYVLDVTAHMVPGVNTLTIDVTNTLAKKHGDNIFDRAMPQEPSGLVGPVRLLVEEFAQ